MARFGMCRRTWTWNSGVVLMGPNLDGRLVLDWRYERWLVHERRMARHGM